MCHRAVLVDGEYVGLIGVVHCVGVIGGDAQPTAFGQVVDEDHLAGASAQTAV